MRSRLSTRLVRVSATAAILAAVAVIAGCGASATGSGAGKVTKITWGIYADPSRMALAQAQVKLFEKSNPDIQVTVDQIPFATYYTKLGAQVASGTAYDVMMMSGSYFSKIAPSGALENLSGLIKTDHLNLKNYTTEPLDSIYKGGTYTLPYEIDIQGLFYNKAYFNAKHVPYPTASWTWADLLSAAKKLTGTIDGKKVYGFYSDDLYPSWVSFIGQAGGSVMNSSGTAATLTTPAATSAIGFMRDLVYRYHVSPTPGQVTTNTDPFETGQVAMAVEGAYSLAPVLAAVKSPWGVAPLPAGKTRAVAYWTQGIAVYAHTQHIAAANKFAEFLMSAPAETVMAKQKFAMPSLKSIDSSPAFESGPPSGMASFAAEVPYEVPVPFVPQWFALMEGPTSAMGEPFASLWLNKIPVSTALAQAQQKSNTVIKGS
jgi:multiple sugar transport system substrate-binding protein